ncbi:MAG: hypothetical protein KA923_05245, partial [Opitutaceae bacterium]|nr:hypothetical protein [Opitutaceae bacterium]
APRLSGYAQRAPSKNTQLEVSCSMLPRTPYIKPTFKLILESATFDSEPQEKARDLTDTLLSGKS